MRVIEAVPAVLRGSRFRKRPWNGEKGHLQHPSSPKWGMMEEAQSVCQTTLPNTIVNSTRPSSRASSKGEFLARDLRLRLSST